MDLDTVIYILIGSTFGLILRFFIKYNFKRKIVFNISNSLIVNILSSLFLGTFLALNLINKDIILLFFVGFLGCFSTFSSFIYELFDFIQQRQYISLILYYIKVLVLSFLFFCLGYFITLIFKNWINYFF